MILRLQFRRNFFMNTSSFHYQTQDNLIFFTDTLNPNHPYISETPRDHESLFFVTNGTLLYEEGTHSQIIDQGQVGYIRRGSIDKSSAYHCDQVSYIAVNFCIDKENPVPTLPFRTLCSDGTAYPYENLFSQALHYFLLKSPGYLPICSGLLLQIIGFLYNEHTISPDTLQKMQKIRNSMDYLKEHYDEPELKISTLSQIENMSEKHFRRIFIDVYKKTPYAYLQEFRISKAEILLLNTTKSISDIAFQCGFSDIYSFSHCFKNHVGVSPANFRS